MARPSRIARRAKLAGYGPNGRSAWLDVDWVGHLRWVDTAGGRVNVVDIGPAGGGGDAPPLILVHGLAGAWQNWLENIPHFAGLRRVVALDLPGFGRSPMPAEPISIPGYAACIQQSLDALGIGSGILIGHSLGGFAAAETAIRYRERIERLVLVSAAGLTAESVRAERRLAALRRSEQLVSYWGTWLATRSDILARRRRMRRLLMAIAVLRADLLPGPLLAEQLRGSGTPGYVDAVHALVGSPLRARLEKIGCPTLIVWGAQDRLVPVRDAYEFARLIPTSQTKIFDRTGHMPMLERPAAFNALVDEFLAGALD
jgi:4,5:9,10-diseco-3-hydroxy-5,9,17-trioxoandrosta-1(10),2-diene-4-oate hydrolase